MSLGRIEIVKNVGIEEEDMERLRNILYRTIDEKLSVSKASLFRMALKRLVKSFEKDPIKFLDKVREHLKEEA